MTIEELKVLITGDTSKLTSALNTANSALRKLNNTAKTSSNALQRSFSSVSTSVNKISNSTNKLRHSLKTAISISALVAFGKQALDAASDLEEVQNVVENSFFEMGESCEQFAKIATDRFGLSVKTAKEYSSTLMAMSNSMGITRKNGAIMSTQLTALAADIASFYNVDVEEAFESLTGIYTGITRGMRRYGILLNDATLEEYRLAKGIKTSYSALSEKEKLILRYNYVMEHTTAVQGDFLRTQNSFANQVRVLQERWKALAGTIGSILIPVFERLLSVINIILSALNTLLTRVAGVFGITIKSGSGAAASFGGVSDSIDEATDSAKAYKKTIASFDELETLTPQSSGGSGAGGGIGVGETINADEYYNFLENVTNQADVKFNDLLQKLDDSILKFRNKAETLATQLGEYLNGVVNGINWNLLGKTIADGTNLVLGALNNFYEAFDFTNLGKSIATSINSLFTNVEWDNVGRYLANKLNSIADIIRGFVKTIEWEKIGKDFLDAFLGMVKRIKWSEIGDTIATAINGIFTTLNTFLAGHPVEELGRGFANMINTAVSKIDAAAIGKAVNSIVQALIAAIKEIDWAMIGDKIKEAFDSANVAGNVIDFIIEKFKITAEIKGSIFAGIFGIPQGLGVALAGLAQLLQPIISLISKIANLLPEILVVVGLFSPALKTLVGEFGPLKGALSWLGTFFLDIPGTIKGSLATIGGLFTSFSTKATSIFKTLGSGLSKGLGTFLTGAKSLLSKAGGAITGGLGTFIASAKGALSSAGTAITTGVSTALTAIKGALSAAVEFIIANPIALIIAAIVALVTLIATKGDEIQGLLRKLNDWLQGVFTRDWTETFGVLGNILNGFFKTVKDIWDAIYQVWNGVIDFIRGVFTGDWERAWNGIKEIFTGIWEGIGAAAKGPVNMIIGFVNAAIGGITKALNWVISKLNSLSFTVPDWVPLIGGETFGFNINPLQEKQIAYLANGGVITSPTLAMMGEYANAASNPEIVTPQSILKQTMADSNDNLIDVLIQLNRQLINTIENKDMDVKISDYDIAASIKRSNLSSLKMTGSPILAQ